MDEHAGDATLLLQRLTAGDAEAGHELFALLYADLKRRAESALAGERAGHTLQPTALVHEAWVRLVLEDGAEPRFEGRAHFVRTAARAMRRVLVDHARARRADKRGGGGERVPLDAVVEAFEERAEDLLALEEALQRLAADDEELARLVELRFFAGLTIAETARVLGVGTATVERGWNVARLRLRADLPGGDGAPRG